MEGVSRLDRAKTEGGNASQNRKPEGPEASRSDEAVTALSKVIRIPVRFRDRPPEEAEARARRVLGVCNEKKPGRVRRDVHALPFVTGGSVGNPPDLEARDVKIEDDPDVVANDPI